MSKSVLADDLHIKGDVTSTGDVQLDGVVEGDITTRTLAISKDAKIKGSLTSEKAVLGGRAEGIINAASARLTPTANVRGELICNALSVDEEAYFNGTAKRVEDPLKKSNP